MKTISCTLSKLDKAIKELDKYQKELNTKLHTAVEKVSDVGTKAAQSGFSSAIYDGENDVDVKLDWSDSKTAYIIAKGDTVAFIEFGTGVTFLVPAPYEPEYPINGLVGRGEYGHGRGKNSSWYYYGEPGTDGTMVNVKGRNMIETHGNPANMCLYYAYKDMVKQAKDIVKEVFR